VLVANAVRWPSTPKPRSQSRSVSLDARAARNLEGNSTAKAALDGLLASLKWEAGAAGLLVNIVSPGFTVTENNLANFSDDVRESVRERTPSRRLSVPEDVAKTVLLLGSPSERQHHRRLPPHRRRYRLASSRQRDGSDPNARTLHLRAR
jgi:NAD(P)-dependent dehydrogenase (short-subunit alcohol dehydrogenase family)